MVAKAWNDVSSITIANCFYHAGLSTIAFIENKSADVNFATLENALPMVSSNVCAFLQIDDDVIIAKSLSNEEIALSSQLQTIDDTREDEEEFGVVPRLSEARAALDIVQTFFIRFFFSF